MSFTAVSPFKQLKLKYRPTTGKIYFTYADLKNFPEWPESPLLELSKGELFVVPSPNTVHQDISSELNHQFRSFLKKNPIGKVFTAPYDIIFSEEDTVIPDLVYVSNANVTIITSQNITGSPDLILEIVSTNRKRDFIEKKELYEQYKVKEYILVDPKDKKIYQYQLINQTYSGQKEYLFTDEISINSVPGLIISLKDYS